MEKTIKEKDIYFMQVIEDKIIINDNYEGILIFDTNMNLLKEMHIFENISIYTSYVIGSSKIILFCPENEKIVYTNLEKYTSKIIEISDELSDIIDIKLFSIGENRCIFVTPQNEYIELDWKYGTLKRVCENIFLECNQKCCDGSTIAEEMRKILVENDDYINTDVKGQLFVVVYEKEIIFYNGRQIKKIVPKKNYIFNNAKFIKKGEKIILVILSNNKEDDEVSIISVVSIEENEE